MQRCLNKSMNQILVTGGAGFIGSNFIRYLLSNNEDIYIHNLDLLTYAGSQENLKNLPNAKRYSFIQGDICDQKLVEKTLSEKNIDTIVHFAAESHVDRSITGPGAFIHTNINGTFALLEAARKVWITEKKRTDVRFHHISTDEVFGSLAPNAPAFCENTPYAPNSPYAASKAASDHLVRAYGHTYGLPITISNCSNNYGPYQFPEKLIPLMLLNAMQGKPLPIYGNGQQIRDWLYVDDHCEAIWLVIQHGRVGESYNIGGENQPANLEIVNTICSLLDEILPNSPYRPHNQFIKYVADRPGHDRRYAMNINKIKKELGWQPKHALTDGLSQTANWYVENQEWVNAIQKQQEYQGWLDKNYTQREKK